MISALDPASQRFLNDLERISVRLERAQRQLASGLRLGVPSDDPDQVSHLLQTRSDLARITQIGSNLSRTKTEVDAAESVLSSAVDLVERARVLGAQGASDIRSAETRTALSGEIASILDQLVRIANTRVEGRYVFSGDSDQQQAFTIDLSQDLPISTYMGSEATRQSLHPTGSAFAVAHTADTIFNALDPTENVFTAVNDLRLALRDNDSAAISTALATLETASRHLDGELVYYGTVQNCVDNALDTTADLQTQLKQQVSRTEDADAAEAITELSQAALQQQTALSARAKIPARSLFDFLA